jgi:outer membrane biogenesis lipoprotein LolB
MNIFSKYKIFLIMLVYLLAGCAPINQNLFVDKNKDTLYPFLNEWNASGRFIFNHGEESINAKFIWKQEKEEFELRILSSLGMKSIVFRGNNQGINSIEGVSSDDIISYEHLLELIPLSEMRFWLTGNPNPMIKFSPHAKNSERISFLQSGWNVKILENREIESMYFPEKINISNSESTIIILIYDWKI